MKKKFLSLLLALAMVCSVAMPAFAAEETAQYTVPADVSGKLVILHTNDTHGSDEAKAGSSIGTAGVAQLKKEFEAAGAEVILMSAGDAIMGGPLVSISKGEAAIEFMNAAKYDVMTIGNHEMDFGYDNLKDLIKIADFPVLGANVLDANTKKPVLESNKIFTTASGLKVGVFGLATPETLTKADANKMQGITFSADADDLYAAATAQVEALKKDGAEFIVCLGHLGVDEGSADLRSVDVCNNVEGIDLFVDGHSHTVMENGVPQDVDMLPTFENKSETLIVSTGTGLANVGVVVYDKEAKTLTSDLISVKEYSKTDAEIVKMINAVSDENNVKYGDKIATTEVNLNGSRSGGAGDSATSGTKVDFPVNVGNRTAETNLGDFAADAILWQARKVLGEDKVDASLTNGGGIRMTIAKGDVSKLDLLTVFPFGNTVVTLDVTGVQLLEALEAAAATLPTATGSFAQVSGITYIVTPIVPFESTETYPLSTFAKPSNPGGRVTILTVGDKAFDPQATYTIATNDFTAGGGDSYRVFKDLPVKYTGKTLDEALIAYTTDELKGVITAERYGEPQGRIAVIPMDVASDAWYADAVRFNILAGAMNGTDKGFEPGGTLTRAQVVQILYNLAGRPTEGVDKAAFHDLAGKWYADAAHWAAFTGIVNGKTDGSFGGDEVITRAETAGIIAGYAAANDIMVDTAGMAMKEAPDYDKIPAEYLEGMTFCFYAEVMTGDQNGSLNPGGVLTRAEMAQIMYNFAKVPMPIKAAA